MVRDDAALSAQVRRVRVAPEVESLIGAIVEVVGPRGRDGRKATIIAGRLDVEGRDQLAGGSGGPVYPFFASGLAAFDSRVHLSPHDFGDADVRIHRSAKVPASRVSVEIGRRSGFTASSYLECR